jgi:hypothetical protein
MLARPCRHNVAAPRWSAKLLIEQSSGYPLAFDRRKSWLAPAQAGTRFVASVRRSAPAFPGAGGSRALALAFVVVASLALSACGRNGAPELPPGPAVPAVPSAANGVPAAPPVAAAPSEVPAAAGAPPNPAATSQAVAEKTGFDSEGNPVAAPGQKRPFLLDPLLR